jgi:HAD superfamily hydrolase (TIGR01549 family)
MRSFDAVLFDWSGTLVHDPLPDARLGRALDLVGRAIPPEDRQVLSANLLSAELHPDVVAAMRDEDSSSARHRAANMLWFGLAGLDTPLAEALYAFDDDPDNRPLYPDAMSTLASLKALDIKVGVVSDIHLDIRLLLAQQGAAAFVDAYVLSFEHGCQKPDPRMFLAAIEMLELAPNRTLMVGDRASHDGGAAEVGIATLILPPAPATASVRGLAVVTRMVGAA